MVSVRLLAITTHAMGQLGYEGRNSIIISLLGRIRKAGLSRLFVFAIGGMEYVYLYLCVCVPLSIFAY